MAPLASLDCYEVGDVYSSITYYSSVSSPCTGFVYGDYEQYPNFTPSTRRVVLSSNRDHQTRVVTRPDFGDHSSSSSASSFADSSPNVSSMPSASSGPPPRMDPVVVSAPASHPVVSHN
jgi:hypothetical protein